LVGNESVSNFLKSARILGVLPYGNPGAVRLETLLLVLGHVRVAV